MRLGSKILALAAITLAAACGGGGDSTAPTSGNNPPSNPTPPTPPTPTSTNAVGVSNDQFTPSSIQVSPGTTVTWTWASDAVTHNVTFTDGTTSGDKGAGATFSRTFTTTGTFSYHCTIHTGMDGTVVVQ